MRQLTSALLVFWMIKGWNSLGFTWFYLQGDSPMAEPVIIMGVNQQKKNSLKDIGVSWGIRLLSIHMSVMRFLLSHFMFILQLMSFFFQSGYGSGLVISTTRQLPNCPFLSMFSALSPVLLSGAAHLSCQEDLLYCSASQGLTALWHFKVNQFQEFQFVVEESWQETQSSEN